MSEQRWPKGQLVAHPDPGKAWVRVQHRDDISSDWIEVEHTCCAPETCICCICCLRRSDEFGAAFDADDECCDGCHAEMSAPGWPGHQCPEADS